MERMERDFKGIWIPREIWLSPELSIMEKVLFVEIHSLDRERGCYASNRYFAEFFGVSDRQIRNVIASLRGKGFISVVVRNKNERVIRTIGKHRRVPAEAVARLNYDAVALARKWHVGGAHQRSTGAGRKFPGR